MNSIFDKIGLHVYDVEHAYEECQNALESCYLQGEIDRLEFIFQESIVSEFSWNDPTNSMIYLLFDITKDIIESEYPLLQISSYINGNDSCLNFDDEEVIEVVNEAASNVDIVDLSELLNKILRLKSYLSLDYTDLVRIATEDNVLNDLLKGIDNENDFIIYDNLKDLGTNYVKYCEGHTADELGEMLVQGYMHGDNDNTLFYMLSDMSILSIDLK